MRTGYHISIFCLILFLLSGCDAITSNQHDKSYPTTIKKITDQQQQVLTNQYLEENPGLCASVDKYGLNDSKICTDRKILRAEIKSNEERRMQKMANEFLVRNHKFTNIYDAAQLDISKSHGMNGCLKCDGSEGDITTISWKLTYKNQVYEGLEVKKSQVAVFMDVQKVFSVYGHWYQHIVIPDEDRLNYEAARDTLLGKEFTYYDWTGKKTYTITNDSFGEYEDKVIFPYETDEALEMRVCLVVSAGIWHFYIDSTTGELIHKEQTVVF